MPPLTIPKSSPIIPISTPTKSAAASRSCFFSSNSGRSQWKVVFSSFQWPTRMSWSWARSQSSHKKWSVCLRSLNSSIPRNSVGIYWIYFSTNVKMLRTHLWWKESTPTLLRNDIQRPLYSGQSCNMKLWVPNFSCATTVVGFGGGWSRPLATKMATGLNALQVRKFRKGPPGSTLSQPSVRETRCFDLHDLYQPREPWRTRGCQDYKCIPTKSGWKIKFICHSSFNSPVSLLKASCSSEMVPSDCQMNKLRHLALNNSWTSDHHITVVAQRCIV